jgi:formylmethanofuran dehydrogenase subunit B
LAIPTESEDQPTLAAVCPGCPLLCDDIAWKKNGATANACETGQAWFRQAEEAAKLSSHFVNGKEADLNSAIAEANRLISKSRQSVLQLIGPVNVDSVLAASQLAKRLSARLLTSQSSQAAIAARQAFEATGIITSSLGEVRHRADLVVLLHLNLEKELPRFEERFLQPAGRFVPKGRSGRHVISIGYSGQNHSVADQTVESDLDQAVAAIALLEAIAAGRSVNAQNLEGQTGAALECWKGVAERCEKASTMAVIVGESVTESRNASAISQKLAEWTLELQNTSRAVLIPVRQSGDITAENTLIATEGWSPPLDFSAPTAAQPMSFLVDNDGDCLIIAGSNLRNEFNFQALVDSCKANSRNVIALVDQAEDAAELADVVINVATPGMDDPGTLYRLDDVSLPLRRQVTSKRLGLAAVCQQLICSTGESVLPK